MPRILENEALALAQGIDSLPPDQQAQAADVLRRYREQQHDLGEPDWPSQEQAAQESEGRFRALFDDLKNVDSQSPSFTQGLRFSTDPDADRARVAGTAFLSRVYQKQPEEVSRMFPLLRDDYLNKRGQKTGLDDRAFYSFAQGEVKRMTAREKAALEGAKAALRGEDSGKALAAWQAANPDFGKEDSGFFSSGFNKAMEEDGDSLPVAANLLSLLESGSFKSKDGKAVSTPFTDEQAAQLGNMVEQLAGMKPRQRKSIYRAMNARIEAAGYDQKGFWAQMLSELDRGLYRASTTLGTQAGVLSDVMEAQANASQRSVDFSMDGGGGISTPVLSVEEQQQLQRQRDYRERVGEVVFDLQNIVSEKLDPFKPSVSWLNDTIEEGLVRAPGAVLPFMAASAALGFWGAGILFTADFAEQNRRELVGMGMDADQARQIGALAAPAQAAVESLSNLFQLGRFPAVSAALARFTKPVGGASLVGRYVQNSLLAGVTEFTEEQIQDNFIVPASQELLAALNSDMPDVDWSFYKERAIQATPELAATLLPMALVFGGVMTAADARLSAQMTGNIDALTALNFSQAQATEIVSQKTTEERIAKAASLWRSRAGNKASLEEGAKNLSAKLRELSSDTLKHQQELERRGILPRMLHAQDDSWLLTYNDGSTASFATHGEASKARWNWAEDQLGRMHALTREALTSMERNMSAGRELAVEFKPDARTAQDVVNEGAGMDQVLRRVEQGKTLGDVPVEESFDNASAFDQATQDAEGFLSSLQILGSSRNEFKDGILRTTIKLWEGSNVLTLVEEKLEGDAKAILQSSTGRAWMLGVLRNYEQESGDKLFRDVADTGITNDDLAEAWSHLGQSYLVGRSSFGEPLQQNNMRRFSKLLMRAGLAGAINAESTFWQAVVNRAQKLGELKKAGKLGEDLAAELERQLGIDSQVVHEQGAMQEAQQVARDVAQQASDYVDDSQFDNLPPSGDTFSMASASGAAQTNEPSPGGLSEAEAEIKSMLPTDVRADYQKFDQRAPILWRGETTFPDVRSVKIIGADASGKSRSLYPSAAITLSNGGVFVKRFRVSDHAQVSETAFRQYDLDYRLTREQNESEKAFDKRILQSAEADLISAARFAWEDQMKQLRPLVDSNYAASLEQQKSQQRQKRSAELQRDETMRFMRDDTMRPAKVYRNKFGWTYQDGILKDAQGQELGQFANLDAARFWIRDEYFKSSRAAGGTQETFSTSRAIPADASKVVQMPDGARLVGPTTFSIRAFHGTPHKVDKFSLDKIGTGEGAQAYGWGLYFAEVKRVAQGYQAALSAPRSIATINDLAQEALSQSSGDAQNAITSLLSGDVAGIPFSMIGRIGEAVALLQSGAVSLEGNLYTVELLPDESDFLDWDKPLSEQSEKVKAALSAFSPSMTGADIYADVTRKNRAVRMERGVEIHDIAFAEKQASKFLQSRKISGIRYLDGRSRGAGDGTRNYVIFDENLVRILEENGKPVENGQTFSIAPSALSVKPPKGVIANKTDALPSWTLPKSEGSVSKVLNSPKVRAEFYAKLDKAIEWLRADPAQITTAKGWVTFMRKAGVWGEIPMPPSGLADIIADPATYVAKLNGGYHGEASLSDTQTSAKQGMDGTVEMRKLIGEGKAPAPFVVALHNMWGILSRMLSPIDQEGMWLRLIAHRPVLDAIQASIDGKFSMTVAQWKQVVQDARASSAVESGPIGNAATSNANDFYLMLSRLNGRWNDMADVYAAPNSREMGRRFWNIGAGKLGIKNKVQRFIGLTFGTPGVIMDRWKFVEFWLPTAMEGMQANEPSSYFNYSANTPSDPVGVYGVYGGIDSENEALSLAMYEAFEVVLEESIAKSQELQDHLGEHANAGGMHWFGWNAIKNEAVGHSSLDLTKELIATFGLDIDAEKVHNTVRNGTYYTEGSPSAGNTVKFVLERGKVRVERTTMAGGLQPGRAGRNTRGAGSRVAEGRTGTIEAIGETFSLRPGDFASRVEAMFSPFQRSPEARLVMARVAKDRALKLAPKVMELQAVLNDNIAQRQNLETNLAEESAKLRADLEADEKQVRDARDFELKAVSQDKGSELDRERIRRDADNKLSRLRLEYERNIRELEKRKETETANLSRKDNSAQREKTRQLLRVLDGILAAAPPEVRARVGGFVKMAGIATDDAALRYLEDRVAKLNTELEKFLIKSARQQLERIFDKSRPKAEAGEKAKGKLTPEAHAWFNLAEQAAKLSPAVADERIEGIEKSLSEEMSAAVKQELSDWLGRPVTDDAEAQEWQEQRLTIFQTFGSVLYGTDSKAARNAAETTAAFELARKVYQDGRLANLEETAKRREKRAADRADGISRVGSPYDPNKANARKKALNKASGLKGRILDYLDTGLDASGFFLDLLGHGDLYETTRRNILEAEMSKDDAMRKRKADFAALLQKVFPGKSLVARLRGLWELQNIQEGTPVGSMSQLQAVQLTLWWMDLDSREWLESNGYGQAWQAQAESWLTSEARAVRSWLLKQYEDQYNYINPVFRRLRGVNLPRVDVYGGKRQVEHSKSDSSVSLEMDQMRGGMEAGFTKTRVARPSGPPKMTDALQNYWQNAFQVEHYVAFAETITELKAVFGHRDFRLAVETNRGQDKASQVADIIKNLEQAGTRDAFAHTAQGKLFGRYGKAVSATALLFKLSVIAKQAPAMIQSMFKVGFKEYMTSLGRILSGKGAIALGDMYRSDTVQRRLSDHDGEMAQAAKGWNQRHFENEIIDKATIAPDLVMNAGWYAIGWTDALFTTVSAAVAYDVAFRNAKSLGMPDDEAKAYAKDEADLIVMETAQPQGVATKSLFENQAPSSLLRLLFAFQSANRQAFGLAWLAAKTSKKDTANALFTAALISAIAQTAGGLMRMLTTDDEPEDIFTPEAYLLGMSTATMTGIPLMGPVIEFITALGGAEARTAVNPAAAAAKSLSDLLDGKADSKDISTIMNTVGLALGGRGASIGVGWNVLNQLMGLYESATD